MTHPPQQPDPNRWPPTPPRGQPHPSPPRTYPVPPGLAPPPMPVNKKMSTSKILLIVAGGLVGLCCLGGIVTVAATAGKPSHPQAAANSAATPASTSPASQTTAPATRQAKPTIAKLGQPVRDGKFEFVVSKVTCGRSRVGDAYLNKTAQGQFCLVNMSVRNIGKEAQIFDGSSQKAFGSGGVEYSNDSVAETYANENDDTFLNEINPGNRVTGVLVFDIPKGATIKRLELHDSAFSGGVNVDVT